MSLREKIAALPRIVEQSPYRGGPARVSVLLEDVLATLDNEPIVVACTHCGQLSHLTLSKEK